MLTEKDKINEYVMTSLRTSWGCNLEYIKTSFGVDYTATYASYLENLEKQDLARLSNNILFLSQKGKFLADKITGDLFLT